MATTTVNSRFLAITASQPNINQGWQIKVFDYKNPKALVAVISEFVSFTFSQELSAAGTGSVTLDEGSPFWDERLANGLSTLTLQDHEYVFEAWENGVAQFAWLGQTVNNTILTEDESHAVTIAGPGIAQVLTWAVLMRPGWPKKPPVVGKDANNKPIQRSFSSSDSKPAFIWQFPIKWASMRMWYTVFKAAQRRGVIPFVTLMFDGLTDANKQKWQYVRTVQNIVDNHGYQPEELNETLLDFLNDCTGQDYSKWFGQRLEWMMRPGFKLDVRRHIGVDRYKTVRFFTGQILSNERTRDREAIYNRVTAVDVEGTESISLDATSVKNWNLREQRNETNKNITDNTLRAELARRYLAQSKDEKSQWTIKIPYDDYGRVPFRDFKVGDYVGLSLSGDGAQQVAKYRVMAITVSMSSDSVVPECELTLQSLIDAKMIELQKRITQLINEPRNFKLDDLKDISIPAKPKVKSTLVYNPKTGKWEAVPVTTPAPSVGTDIHVYIQSTDPAIVSGNTVGLGDFWVKTS